jgi:tetratricopeptide (TPR) repeat protein
MIKNIYPNNSLGYIETGSIYQEINEYKKSIKTIRIAIKQEPSNAYPYCLQGMNSEFYQSALIFFKLSNEKDPTYYFSYNHIGRTLCFEII